MERAEDMGVDDDDHHPGSGDQQKRGLGEEGAGEEPTDVARTLSSPQAAVPFLRGEIVGPPLARKDEGVPTLIPVVVAPVPTVTNEGAGQ